MSNETNTPTPSFISKAASFLGIGAGSNRKIAGLERELEAATAAQTTELQKLDSELEKLEAHFAESGSADLAGQLAEREAERAKVAGWHQARLSKLEAALANAQKEAHAAEVDSAAQAELSAIVARAKARSAFIEDVTALCARLEPVMAPRAKQDPEVEARLVELLETELPESMRPFWAHSRLDDVPLAALSDRDAAKTATDRLALLVHRLGELCRSANATDAAQRSAAFAARSRADDEARAKRQAENVERLQREEARKHPERALRAPN